MAPLVRRCWRGSAPRCAWPWAGPAHSLPHWGLTLAPSQFAHRVPVYPYTLSASSSLASSSLPDYLTVG